MKIAILGESSADEEAVTILVTAILGAPIERPATASLRARGCTQLITGLPRVITALHFNSDAFGLVLVIESNGKSIHTSDHDAPGKENFDCRFCNARSAAQRTLASLPLRSGLQPLRIAIGLAVPTIEAWLLSRNEAGMTEANWRKSRQEKREPFSRAKLKEMLYGTKSPGIQLETEKICAHMTEIVTDLERFRTAFPGGFGPLYDEIRQWK
jgi:hypothetical protein